MLIGKRFRVQSPHCFLRCKQNFTLLSTAEAHYLKVDQGVCTKERAHYFIGTRPGKTLTHCIRNGQQKHFHDSLVCTFTLQLHAPSSEINFAPILQGYCSLLVFSVRNGRTARQGYFFFALCCNQICKGRMTTANLFFDAFLMAVSGKAVFFLNLSF